MDNPKPSLIYSDEVRLFRGPAGDVWAEGWGGYAFLRHFLQWFSDVTVVARIKDVDKPPTGVVRGDGPGISFHEVPYYIGPAEYLRSALKVRGSLQRIDLDNAVVLMRCPSLLAATLGARLQHIRKPYGLLVTADPATNFQSGANKHPFRHFFKWKYVRDMRGLCSRAAGVAYVTQRALQKHYPPGPLAVEAAFSGVELHDEWYASQPRVYAQVPNPLRIVTVASFVQLYKGQDVLLRALARCKQAGLAYEAVFIGDGRHRADMESLATSLNISSQVRFPGAVPFGSCIRAHLDQNDLFVLPSRSEGLPRAMIEAMGRALPCIATDVGGNSELLDPEALVSANQPETLATKLLEAARSPELLTRLSKRSLETSQAYRFSKLLERRGQFYLRLIEMTKASN